MLGVNVTRMNLMRWSWYNVFPDVINLNKGKEFTIEQLLDKIKEGKTAIVAISKSIKKSDLEALLDGKFKILAIKVSDFKKLREYVIN